MTAIPRKQILVGDALTRLRDLPAASVDSVVTSPPYFRLRDYGVDGQLGLEAHVDQWVAELRRLLRETARVLVPTGTVFLNLGDTYSTHPREGANRKSLLLAPERLALALIEDGWSLRNKVVWAKTNTLPTSARDRLATHHEVIYLLTRSPRYYFDLDSLRVPHRTKPRPPTRPGSGRPPTRRDLRRPGWLGPNGDGDAGLAALKASGLPGHPLGKNPGDVWQLPASKYTGAHFATFPVVLAERMVLAGTPEQRCSHCRTAYQRPVRRLGAFATRLSLRAMCQCNAATEPGLVLDPFLGAGTTAIAAERLGRDWLGIELNASYVAMATERLEAERNKPDDKPQAT